MIPFGFEDFDSKFAVLPDVSFTYEIKKERDKIKDYIDGLKAVCQTIYKILMTEKNNYEIYDDDFGIELSDLIGENIYYVQSELPVRIENALISDSRILRVYDFSFYRLKEKSALLTKFYVYTVFGETEYSLEVSV